MKLKFGYKSLYYIHRFIHISNMQDCLSILQCKTNAMIVIIRYPVMIEYTFTHFNNHFISSTLLCVFTKRFSSCNKLCTYFLHIPQNHLSFVS